jgi:cell fate (sporulation/competence/biofilm development) regulator YlbF (YheA/YmcA/DUF963 family)
MISSTYLYGSIDKQMAGLQKELFTIKKAKALQLIRDLQPHFNLLDFSQRQKDLEWRIDRIKKAIVFCDEQIEEANEVLYGEEK